MSDLAKGIRELGDIIDAERKWSREQIQLVYHRLYSVMQQQGLTEIKIPKNREDDPKWFMNMAEEGDQLLIRISTTF